MVRLSVNVNKVATLRNSRGGHEPDMAQAVETCIAAGAPGITVHPRADERHIRPDDVRTIAALLDSRRDSVEFNIEGDPRPDLVDMVLEVRPHQCTLVPVIPGEITSQAGWRPEATEQLRPVLAKLHERGIRVSLFVEADPLAVEWAAKLGADRVELYTEPYARAFEAGEIQARESFARFSAAAQRATALGLGINAGHDLDLDNLVLFRSLPRLDEVSIGHALISKALFEGLDSVVRQYLAVLAEQPSGAAEG